MRSFDLQTFGGLLLLGGLGQDQLQHALVVLGLDGGGVDAGDVEGAAVRAVAALAAQVLVALILVLMFGVALGGDGQSIVIQIQVDVLLFKARQVCRDLEVVTLVGDVGAEGVGKGPAKIAPRIIEEMLFDLLQIGRASCRERV